MKFKKIIISIIFLLELFVAKLWFACRDFSDSFHFSYPKMNLDLLGAVNNDQGFSTAIVRFFHNKPLFLFNQIFARYLHFWDIRFGVMFFSLAGYFGILAGFWYLTKTKNKYKLLIFAALLFIPFIEVFSLPLEYKFRFVILSLPYQLLSIFGYWQFTKLHQRRAILFLTILISLSIWYIGVFQKDIFFSCLKI